MFVYFKPDFKANWSYYGFGAFRRKLAKLAKIDLTKMKGYGGNTNWDGVKDNLKILLSHDTIEGTLTPEECGLLSIRLKELIEQFDKNSENDQEDIKQCYLFIESLNYCFTNNKELIFIS